MSEAIRFSISTGETLLKNFDELIEKKGYGNRSEAIRELIRKFITESEWQEGDIEVVGTITLIYNHEVRQINEGLTELQHDFHSFIISSLHVHLDEHNCLEVLAVKGRGDMIRLMASKLKNVRGVKHAKVTIGTTGKALY